MLTLSNKSGVKRMSNAKSTIIFVLILLAMLIPIFIWGDMS